MKMNVDIAITVPVNFLPLIDDTDFKTREAAVVYNQAGLEIYWNFVTTAGVVTKTAITPTTGGGNYDWTNNSNGFYELGIPASGGVSVNNDTEGFGWISGYATGILPWSGPIIQFSPAIVNNSLVNGTDNLQVDMVQIGGDTQSATDLKDFADAGYDPGTNKVQGVVLVDTTTTNTDMVSAAPTAVAIRTEIDSNSTQLAAIVADTNELQTDWVNGGRLDLLIDAILVDTNALNDTKIPDTLSLANINAQVDTALSDINLDHLIQVSGTVSDVGATSGDFDTDLAEATDSHYNDMVIVFTAGVLAGQARRISAYTGISKNIAVLPVFTEAPGNGDAFVVMSAAYLQVVVERLNTQAKADVNAECDTALTDYDAVVPADLPTNFGDLAITVTTGRVDVGSIEGSDATNQIRDAVLDDATRFSGASVSAIKAKTDNLPADPASETNVNANETKIDTLTTRLGTPVNIDAKGASIAANIAALADDNAGTTYDATTDSLEAIRDRGDAAWITGGGGGITDILNIQPIIPTSIDLANTATVRLGLMLTNAVDDLPSTAEITPGTISIERKAIGGTSWSAVVTDAACSEAAGQIYYDEVFDTGTGYAEGDSIRITFKSQKITVVANDYEITDATGVMFQTEIRQTMRGTDSAALASVCTEGRLAELDAANLPADVDNILLDTGTDGVVVAAASKAGYSLSAAGIQAIWDALTSALTTVGSIGKKLADWVLGTDNKNLISTDAQDLSATLDVNTKTLTSSLDLTTSMKASVNTEVDNALNTAIPGTPTADSINERIKAVDDGLTAVRAGYLDNLSAGAVAQEATSSDIQSRLPAALVGGKMNSDATAISGSTDAADKLEAVAEINIIGAAVTGTLSTTQMTTNLTEATDNHYNGRIIIWTSGVLLGQATDITDYDGTSKLLTFTEVTEAPSNGDTFVII